MVLLAGEDDAALVAALRAGDEQAYARVVRALEPALLRVVETRVPNRAVAEEVVQETWVVVMRSLDAFQGRSRFSTWVVGIALNTAKRTGERERRWLPAAEKVDLLAAAVPPERFDASGSWTSLPRTAPALPEQAAVSAETRGLLEGALATLPARQRRAVVLKDVVGVDGAELPDLLGVSATNARALLARGRARLRAAVEAGLLGEPVPLAAARAARVPRRGPLACRHLVGLVSDWLDGGLAARDRVRVEEHLGACDACTSYVEQVREVLAATAALAGHLPPDLRDRLDAEGRRLLDAG